ncbi:MAG: alpha-N-arabinofuranosidase, partial [Acidobacteriota bacterium]
MAMLAAAVFCLGCGVAATAQQDQPKVPDRLMVNIDTQQTAAPVSKYQFGMFIEHIGPLIYRSLWSEMLDDRKFYFPIKPAEAKPATPQRGGPFGRGLRQWVPVGPADAVTMDKNQPFVGAQSPRVQLDGSTPRGIVQAGIAVVNGKQYTGRIYLRGAAGTHVNVALIWGEGAGNRQTISVGPLTSEYKEFPLRFTAKADSQDASFEVAGTGSGDFHVGAVSLMPADNIDGFRPDTIALLRQLHSGMWRLPGGNFLSDWDWHVRIGPKDTRPPTYDYAWNAMQP